MKEKTVFIQNHLGWGVYADIEGKGFYALSQEKELYATTYQVLLDLVNAEGEAWASNVVWTPSVLLHHFPSSEAEEGYECVRWPIWLGHDPKSARGVWIGANGTNGDAPTPKQTAAIRYDNWFCWDGITLPIAVNGRILVLENKLSDEIWEKYQLGAKVYHNLAMQKTNFEEEPDTLKVVFDRGYHIAILENVLTTLAMSTSFDEARKFISMLASLHTDHGGTNATITN